MTKHKPRPTHAALVAQGRSLERADVLAQLRQSVDGARAIKARGDRAGVDDGIDIDLYIARLEALIGTIETGCHVGLGQ